MQQNEGDEIYWSASDDKYCRYGVSDYCNGDSCVPHLRQMEVKTKEFQSSLWYVVNLAYLWVCDLKRICADTVLCFETCESGLQPHAL